MHVLCPIGQRGGPELVQRLAEVLDKGAELLLLHVIDTGPRHDLKHLIEGLRHGPASIPGRGPELSAAEETAGETSLAETQAAAEAAGFGAQSRLAKGRPEDVIMQVAREESVSLICISAREGAEGHPHIGPASVGHTARFVLDHAPCDVLLLREND
ncbi:MAG TPA: universal stress protein [Pyrinomonadaceae bacterium]|jgi:nucleotide-binding universal stress UspA family protein